MEALVMRGDRQASVVSDRPLPQLRPGYIMLKPIAVALNPTDWKHIDDLNRPGLLCGSDYAGIVEKTGTGYTKNWKVGDRISGIAHGGNSNQPEDDAFAEHIVVKADVQWQLPDHMSFEEGSTLGVGAVTCGQGLFQTLKLDLPMDGVHKKDEFVLIYGGSTATGALGIQFLKL
jgi:NADPH:quinone reductase-like Zn-dependent oxidoreductase